MLGQSAAVGVRQSPFAGIDDSIAELSRLTGLRPLKKVQYDTIDKPALKKYLDERVSEEVKPAEIRAEELTLKKFGLVPQDFDLKATTIDLLTEQAAAFYDYREKKLYLMQGSDPSTQGLFIFHELAHALADQHFDLRRYIRNGKNDDSSLARLAVTEGQATWLMFESMAQKMGQSLKSSPAMAEMLGRNNGDQFSSQYPVLTNAPLYIRSSLLFPYTDGMRFQNALIAKLDKEGFAKPFKDAPVSTHQIMHPEVYLSGRSPTRPEVPKLANAKDWVTIADGTVGEFDHAVLLEQYRDKQEASSLSPAWRGGSFALMEHKRSKRVVLLYASDWDTEANAKRMFTAYRSVLKGKWQGQTIESETPESISGSGDDGKFRTAVSGTRVTSVEGFASLQDVAAWR